MRALVVLFVLAVVIAVYVFVNDMKKAAAGHYAVKLEKVCTAEADWTKNLDGTPQGLDLTILKDDRVFFSQKIDPGKGERTLTDPRFSFEIDHAKETTYLFRLGESKVITSRDWVSIDWEWIRMKGGHNYSYYAPKGEWPFNGQKIPFGTNSYLVFTAKLVKK